MGRFLLSLLLLSSLLVSGRARSSVPAPRYVVDLDQKPEHRWSGIVPQYKEEFRALLKEFKQFVGPELVDLASVLGEDLDDRIPYPYDMEMVGVALAAGFSLGEVLLGNMIYEVTAFNKSRHLLNKEACTSIVAEASDGTVFHGRNLDYSHLDILRNLTITVDFQSSGKTVYTGTTFVGYVGLITGQRANAYTISLNQRNEGVWWENILGAVSGTSAIVSFLIRDTLGDTSLTFEGAVEKLGYKPLIAPCYLIIGGVYSNQGVVITRDRIAALDIWKLNAAKGRWFLVETNYDHWEPPPPSDDRRDPAIKAMNETGRANVNGTALYKVLSVPPVLNNDTSYTVTMSASHPEIYNTWIRYP